MNETNPQGGVTDGSVESAVARLVQSDDNAPDEAQQAETPESQPGQPAEQPAEAQQPSDELTPDDLESDQEPQAQPAVDAFEIVHNGQQHKLTREETIRYAQQGFDYTQKTQQVAEQARLVQQRLQALAEVEQVQPQVMQHLAQVKALESQLAQYQNVDWVQVATDDPVGYAPARARFDVLRNAYEQAVGQFQHMQGQVQQRKAQIQQQMLMEEAQRLPAFVPEWKDAAKLEAGKAEIRKYLEANQIPVEAAGRYLDSAFALATAYKAAKYDQLLKAKGEKSKQLRTAPPVTVPGAKTGSAKAEQEKQLRDKLKRTKSIDDAAALLLNRMR
jgi:hypothetical protein